jgi:hypothetical protein
MTEDSARLQYLLEPLAHAHGAHLGSDAVVAEAVLTDAFVDEASARVTASHRHGSDEPAGPVPWSALMMGEAEFKWGKANDAMRRHLLFCQYFVQRFSHGAGHGLSANCTHVEHIGFVELTGGGSNGWRCWTVMRNRSESDSQRHEQAMKL